MEGIEDRASDFRVPFVSSWRTWKRLMVGVLGGFLARERFVQGAT